MATSQPQANKATPEERKLINQALDSLKSVTSRAITAAKDDEIKAIHENKLIKINSLISKVHTGELEF